MKYLKKSSAREVIKLKVDVVIDTKTNSASVNLGFTDIDDVQKFFDSTISEALKSMGYKSSLHLEKLPETPQSKSKVGGL